MSVFGNHGPDTYNNTLYSRKFFSSLCARKWNGQQRMVRAGRFISAVSSLIIIDFRFVVPTHEQRKYFNVLIYFAGCGATHYLTAGDTYTFLKSPNYPNNYPSWVMTMLVAGILLSFHVFVCVFFCVFVSLYSCSMNFNVANGWTLENTDISKASVFYWQNNSHMWLSELVAWSCWWNINWTKVVFTKHAESSSVRQILGWGAN